MHPKLPPGGGGGGSFLSSFLGVSGLMRVSGLRGSQAVGTHPTGMQTCYY